MTLMLSVKFDNVNFQSKGGNTEYYKIASKRLYLYTHSRQFAVFLFDEVYNLVRFQLSSLGNKTEVMLV